MHHSIHKESTLHPNDKNKNQAALRLLVLMSKKKGSGIAPKFWEMKNVTQ